MTTALCSSLPGTPRQGVRTSEVPGFAGLSRCDSFAPSSDIEERAQMGARRAGAFKPADESDLGEWSMSTPTTVSGVVT